MTRDRAEEILQGFSRREFFKATGLSAVAVGSLALGNKVRGEEVTESKGLSLTVAGYNYSRVQALVDGL